MSEMEVQNKWSLIDALHKKYSNDEPLEFHIFVPKGVPRKEESGDLVVPTCLALNKANITCAGDEREIQKLCHRVCELDIADNNIHDFQEVRRLLDHMPCVSFLNLTRNPLRESLIENKDKTQYPKVTQLVLNKMNIPLTRMCTMLDSFPNLMEVHLSLNALSKADIPPQKQYPSIVKVYLNENNISNWEDINKIGRLFPNLDKLVTIKNPLCAISDVDIEEAMRVFSKLHSLNISDSNFHSWSDIEQLRKLETLTDLRILGIPLWQDVDEKICRQLVIGYLPNILCLNGSPINDGEREDAERAFIRFYMDCEEKPSRYYELEQKCGKIYPLADVDFKNNITVTVHFNETAILNIVNMNWTLSKLMKQLGDMLRLKPSQFSVIHKQACSSVFIPLKYPNQALHDYEIKEGDDLYIDINHENR